MTFRQAVTYFVREASVSLVRSWKVSLVAVLTIAMSLFMGGLFFLVSSNLSVAVDQWGQELKIIVYLAPIEDAGEGDLMAELVQPEWVIRAFEVSAEDAMSRFRSTFPSLADVMSDWQGEALPPSIELTLDPGRLDDDRIAVWIDELRRDSRISMVDDDRDWLRQLGALIALIRGIGLGLGAALLGAAIFTIASVIKLTAYLYLEEIAVMRLVGATEFFIRGPFYAEGFLQGLIGGGLALAGLSGSSYLLHRSSGGDSLWLPTLLGDFLSWQQQALLVLLGAAAGLIGAVLSLRRERLKAESDL